MAQATITYGNLALSLDGSEAFVANTCQGMANILDSGFVGEVKQEAAPVEQETAPASAQEDVATLCEDDVFNWQKYSLEKIRSDPRFDTVLDDAKIIYAIAIEVMAKKLAESGRDRFGKVRADRDMRVFMHRTGFSYKRVERLLRLLSCGYGLISIETYGERSDGSFGHVLHINENPFPLRSPTAHQKDDCLEPDRDKLITGEDFSCLLDNRCIYLVSDEARKLYENIVEEAQKSARIDAADSKHRAYINLSSKDVRLYFGLDCTEGHVTALFKELDETGIGLISRTRKLKERFATIYLNGFDTSNLS